MGQLNVSSPSNLTVAGFKSLAAERLRAGPVNPPRGSGIEPSDFDHNPGLRSAMEQAGELKPLRAAAVLVPVLARDELKVLFTKRTETLPSHAGQISFPGGKVDANDADVVATAVREAHEEVGVPSSIIETLGFLDPYETATGFEVQPIVGLIESDLQAVANPNEVAEVFEVPLAFLMDPANHQKHARLYRDKTRYFYAMPFGQHFIWGATAGMLKNMHQRLFAT